MGSRSREMDMLTTLRLEGNGYYTTPWPEHHCTSPSKAVVPQSSPKKVMSFTCSSPPDKPAKRSIWTSIMLGQVLSALIAIMSMSAASLDDRGVNLPSFLNFLNYGSLTIAFLVPQIFSGRWLRLSRPWWRYAVYALVDVEANTLVVLAYRYTSITSIAMLDAFSIPAVMVLSRVFLSARYTNKHLMGVALCLGGLALTVVSDLRGEGDADTVANYPLALRGDVLCILGAALYAGANVMQENFVKNYDRVEFLAMAGLFGAIISGFQSAVFEREALSQVEWTTPVIFFTAGYALSLSVMYSWTSLFLQAGDAAMFNLSLLTSDVYALLFAFLVEHVTPDSLYFVAFAVIFCGLVLYHFQPAPTKVLTEGVELIVGDLEGEGGVDMSPENGLSPGYPSGKENIFFVEQEVSRNSGTYCSMSDSEMDLESAPPSPLTDAGLALI